MAGGFLITYVPIYFMNRFHFIFLISGIVRIIIVIIMLPMIKEVRVTTKPVFNLKNLSIYKWLYDLTLRNHEKNKKLKNNSKNKNEI